MEANRAAYRAFESYPKYKKRRTPGLSVLKVEPVVDEDDTSVLLEFGHSSSNYRGSATFSSQSNSYVFTTMVYHRVPMRYTSEPAAVYASHTAKPSFFSRSF